MNRCPACDTTVVANARFCHACGARLTPEANAHPLAGATDTDRLPRWLKQELEPQTNPEQRVGGQSAPQGWPRPIPDGGLSQSMPAWLSEDASNQDSEAPFESAPPPTTIQFEERTSPVGDRPATIDVASFLTADDLPAWLRHIGDPGTTETQRDLRTTPVQERQPQPKSQPQPMLRLGSRTSRTESSSPSQKRSTAKPAEERMAPTSPSSTTSTSPEMRGRSTRFSWHLLLFVAILAAVAIAGYTIYLLSFS